MLTLVPLLSLAAFAALIDQAEQQDQPVSNTPSTFSLVCLGGGSANRMSNGSVSAWNSDGDYASANIVGNRSVPFDDQVNVLIDGDKGKIRMPRAMLPPIRGGENGWFEIRKIEVSENEITGSVAVNIINSPKLRIDRITGSISISGKAGDYSGRCRPYDPANVQRAF